MKGCQDADWKLTAALDCLNYVSSWSGTPVELGGNSNLVVNEKVHGLDKKL